ncbi:GHKL domain-containing protein [Acidaminobacter sp. JC074]|uniref:sensor histidine kinase n=1 Tax=Acidaminobacter sp. JC074 TaxID=2530199 RepID=UPI001F0DD135|nr:ATP-binding protein [Acidaminobacter sp. JC074]MCH4887140.1 GHKL domain-containing protein [Acidaminobacter sp. JC074]
MKKGLRYLRFDMIIFQILIMLYLFLYGGFLGEHIVMIGFILTAANLIYILYELENIHHMISSDESKRNRVVLLDEEKQKSLNHIKNIKRIYKNESRDTLLHYIEKTQKEYYDEKVLDYDLEILNIILQRYIHICKNLDVEFEYDIQENVKSLLDTAGMTGEQLCTVLGNLFDNSIEVLKNRKNNRQMNLSILGTGYQVIIQVSNNGAKIPDDVKDKLFNYGYSTKAGSRGAGLFIVYKLVEKVNARISVLSDDKRTSFDIVFDLE